MNNAASWEPVMEKARKRLASWKSNLISMGGRLTLIKLVLGSVGTYYMPMFRAPNKVTNKLESMRASFFWGEKDNSRKIHWVKWRLILNSLDQGGLGVPSLNSLNLALLYKWRWRFVTNKNSSWTRLIMAIHGKPQGAVVPCASNTSRTWVSISRMINLIHDEFLLDASLMSIKIGNGLNANFWFDLWFNGVSLASCLLRLLSLDSHIHASVATRLVNNTWIYFWRREPRYGIEVEDQQAL
ncbi:uncharacterized mitochondrial protein AtMg00310-like [Rutidosis leptorrhynchoides]|uniref:uncharacterized mitochondrial protein AtMg00310-like n=1 Tax=Rutidosis leptorrhynchoides TaxID=125765 RepID=UPI003A994013